MPPQTLAVYLREHFNTFSPTERKVARALLQQYPVAGLETIAQLAAKAAVSGPTVLRLVNKLGFDSYSHFQEALRQELERQLQSPLLRRDPGTRIDPDHFLGGFADNIHKLISETAHHLLPEDFELVAGWLSEPKSRIWLIGGYITGPIAEYLCHHLQAIRAQVSLLRPMPNTWADMLVDMGKNDVLVMFDIRRYWPEMQPLAQLAQTRKARSVLLTDQWTSPLAPLADITLTAYTEGKSGWDTNVALMFVVDALIAALNNRDWDATKNRLERIECLRQQLNPRPPG